MDKSGISLYQELYYWTYFYSKKIRKNPPLGIEYTSFLQFLILRMLNYITLWILIDYIFKVIGWDILDVIMHNVDTWFLFIVAMILYLLLYKLDQLLIYKRINKIFAICEQFSKKRRITGQIKFWTYVVFTISSLWYIANLLDSMR